MGGMLLFDGGRGAESWGRDGGVGILGWLMLLFVVWDDWLWCFFGRVVLIVHEGHVLLFFVCCEW